MEALRCLLSILLLAVFGLPQVSPLLAQGTNDETGVPACCRRNGAHHCTMSAGERGQFTAHDPSFRAPAVKCPFSPYATAGSIHLGFSASGAEGDRVDVESHAMGLAQTDCKRRIARDRSRQKRGPPMDTRS